MPRAGLQCVIVVFPDHTNLLFQTLEKAFECVSSGSVTGLVALIHVFNHDKCW